jgi:uncharacterized protein YhaN
MRTAADFARGGIRFTSFFCRQPWRGTADQLYLALRVASVEDYLDRANALPFVADDLFINFDDARAAAGFDVLGQLGTKTQILFFTHHQHLVEIAKATLGKSINIVSLFEPRSAIAT